MKPTTIYTIKKCVLNKRHIGFHDKIGPYFWGQIEIKTDHNGSEGLE